MKANALPTIKSITVIGRRWFDKINGNTYFSTVALVDGTEKIRITHAYGNGLQFEWEAFEELDKAGLLPDREHYENGSAEGPWRYCEKKGIKYYVTVSDVARKKDLL